MLEHARRFCFFVRLRFPPAGCANLLRRSNFLMRNVNYLWCCVLAYFRCGNKTLIMPRDILGQIL
jgi:hypothetical protein